MAVDDFKKIYICVQVGSPPAWLCEGCAGLGCGPAPDWPEGLEAPQIQRSTAWCK